MSGARFHLAQLNIARMRAPLGDPIMAGFESQLESYQRRCRSKPRLLWRLAGEEGTPPPFAPSRTSGSSSTCPSGSRSKPFISTSTGARTSRRSATGAQWFEPMEGPHLVLWWITAGSIPTVEDGKDKLAELARLGPTEDAFTFRQPFPAPGEAPGQPAEVEAEFCQGPA